MTIYIYIYILYNRRTDDKGNYRNTAGNYSSFYNTRAQLTCIIQTWILRPRRLDQKTLCPTRPTAPPTVLRLGVWGFCVYGLRFEALGLGFKA